MKKNEFKKILKPLIRQTVNEVILEEGLLSGIVAEVARGMSAAPLVEKKERVNSVPAEEDYERDRQKRIKRLNESSALGDIFKNTKELPEQSNGALSGVHPQDSGVDISAIQKIANGKWKHLM